MNRSIPPPSSGNLRVATACLLSSLMLLSPLASLAASARIGKPPISQASRTETVSVRAENQTRLNDDRPSAFRDFFNPLAPVSGTITATMTDSFPDPNGDGKADFGEIITYEATISNTGVDATGVTFTDTPDSNTTLIAGSIHASPLAFNDTYNWVGNTVLDTSARSLASITANDVTINAPGGTDTIALNTTPASGPSNGAVTITANGHFVYTPNVGFTGSDSFTYTITNSADSTLVATGTVTINMPTRVWYLQSGASGDGRSHTPSGNPAAISTAANLSTDILFVFSHANTLNGPFTLDNSQQLLGQGVALNLAGFGTLFPAGTAPAIASSAGGNALTLGSGNTLSGFNVSTTSGTAIFGSNVGALNISSVSVNTTGAGLDLTGVSTPTVNISLGSLTSSGGAKNVNLVGLNGTINLGSGALSGSTSGAPNHAFAVSGGGSANITYSGSIAKGNTGNVVNISGRTGGTVTLSGTINGSSSSGINVSSNTGGSVVFSGGTKTLSTGASAAVTLGSNSGATITFSGGGLDIDTTSGKGFEATGGGTINVTTGANPNSIDTTTGTALNVTNTTIGASGLTFRRIAANGATNGIVLTNTGATAGLTVTGDGTKARNGSGGTIQNTISHGVLLNSAHKVTLQSLNIFFASDSGQDSDGINATNCSDITMSGIDINQSGLPNLSPPPAIYHFGFRGLNLGGTNRLDNNSIIRNIRRSGSYGFYVTNHSTNATFTLDSSTFTNESYAGDPNINGSSFVVMSVQGTSVITFNVTNSTFTNLFGSGIVIGSGDSAGSTAQVTANIDNNDFLNATSNGTNNLEMGAGANSTLIPTITNNTFDNVADASASAGIITVQAFDAGRIGSAGNPATISGNTIKNSGTGPLVADIGYIGIRIVPDTSSATTHRVIISNNTIKDLWRQGILASARSQSTLNLKIEGNTVGTLAEPVGQSNRRGIELETQQSGTLNVEVKDNPSIVGSGTSNSNPSLLIRSGTDTPSNTTVNATVTGNTIKNTNAGNTEGRFKAETPATAPGPSNMCLDLRNNVLENAAKEFELIHASTGTFKLNQSGNTGTITSTGTIGTVGNCTLPSLSMDNLSPVGITNDVLTATVRVPAARPAAHLNIVAAGSEGKQGNAFVAKDSSSYRSSATRPRGITPNGRRVVESEVRLAHSPSAWEAGNTKSASTRARVTSSVQQLKRGANNNDHRTWTFAGNASVKAKAQPIASSLKPVGGAVSVSIGTLPTNKSVKIKFQVTVNSAATFTGTGAQVSTQGTVTGNNPSAFSVQTDDNPGTVPNDPTITPIARANLTLTSNTDGVTSTTPGTTLTYALDYKNNGRSATGVTLTETVPTGTTFTATGSSPGWSCADNSPAGTTCTNLIGALAGNATGTKTFKVTVINPAATGLNSFDNVASIADDGSYEPDIDLSDNSKTDTDTLAAAPDLRIIGKTDGVGTTTPGSNLVYTITYENNGNQNATGVVLTETVPVGTTFEATGSSTWTGCADGAPAGTVCTISVGALNVGATPAPVTFSVNVDNPAEAGNSQVNNTVSIDDDHTNGVDPTANNSLLDSDVLNAAPDLTLSKTPDVSNASPGATIIYTLNYENIGTQGATGVVINETVPADTTFTTAGSSAGWSCADGSPAGTVCTLALGAVPAGTNGMRTFAVVVNNSLPGGTSQVSNTATIADDNTNGTDPPGNNSTGSITTSLCPNPAVVTNVNDSGAGSLRQALLDTCEGGTVTFNLGTGAHTITPLSTLVIAKNIYIINTLSGTNGPVTIDVGGGNFRAFRVDNPVTSASLNGLTITGVNATGVSGGGLFAQSGTVTLTNMLFTGNTVINGAGSAFGVTGGATLNVRNTTISGNTATFGGGIYNSGGTLNLLNVTITNNTADGNIGGGPIGGAGAVGGGIETGGGTATNIKNSIVAGNNATSGTNISGPITDQGNNLLTGDPRLAALTLNGGLSQTHALLIDSPALDAGDNAPVQAAGLTADQRGTGFARIVDAQDSGTTQTVDIGAFEADPSVEDISDKTISEDTAVPQFTFNVGDGSTAFDSITAVATINPGLIASINLGPSADSSNRTLDITPAANQTGSATITVTVTKTLGGTPISMTDTFNLTVTDVNDAPTANDDPLSSVAEDLGQRTISIASLLANDSPGPMDESSQTLTFAGVSNPVGGTITSDATNIYFTPTADFNGTASFQYTVSDNGTTNGAAAPQTSTPGTVSFTITEINDAPTAINNGLSSVTEDSGLRIIPFTDLTGNDSAGPANEAGQLLSFKTVSNPVGGTVIINGTNVEFTPTADYHGPASFDYTVEDSGTTNGAADPLTSAAAATVSFAITEVNDAPTATNDGLSSIAEDSGVRVIAFTDLTGNDSTGPANEAGQTLIVKTVSNPVGGTVLINGTNVEFTLTADFNGAASFDYTVEDNGTTNGAADPVTSSSPATVSFTITEVNDAPTATNDNLSNVLEDSGTRIIPFATLTGNDSTGPANEAGQTLVVKTVSNPVGGTVLINGTNVEFTLTADFNGAASFDYTVEDNGTTNGVADPQVSAAAATVTFTIDPVNDAPSFTKGPDQMASGNNPQTITNWATNILAGPPDEAGQTVMFNITNNTNPGLFSTQPSIDPAGTLTFTPIAGVNGTATITVELKDNGGVLNGGVDTSAPQTFNITISPTGWTTTADSGATEDESNPARPTYTNFTASPISGTPAGTYVLRYNITAMGNLTSLGASNTRLRVRFRDEGDGSRVTVAIIQSPITGGATTIGTIFDSDTYLAGSGFQTQEILMPALVFDFTQNTYWLEVTMIKGNASNQPGLGSVQINQQ